MLKLFYPILFFTLMNAAAAKAVAWKNVKFSIDVPENWREVKDFYGIPVTLLGPSVNPKPRAVVQIIPTDSAAPKIEDKDAKGFGAKYAEGRKKWIKEQNGELLDLVPGKFDGKFLSAGVTYRINKKTYLERTFYTPCPKKLFHLKIVLNLENVDELKDSESIVRSFSCDG